MSRFYEKSMLVVGVLIFSGLSTQKIQAQNIWYVNDNSTTGDVFTSAIGNDANSGTAAEPFATVAKAMSSSSNGDTIYVDVGEYTQIYSLNKEVIVRGPNFDVIGTGTRGAEAVFKNGKVNVTRGVLEGFLFEKNNEADYSGNGPVGVSGNNAAIVRNNVFISTTSGFGNNGWAGIEVAMGTGNKVIDNNFFTKGSGFLVKQWRAAIWVNSTNAGFEIINNTFDNTNTGLNLDYEHPGILVEGNTFNSNVSTALAFGGNPGGQYVFGPNTFGLSSTLVNNSNVQTSFRLDLTSSTFGGKLGSDMTEAELFNVESKIYHRGRVASGSSRNGLVTYKESHEFVYNGHTTIQSAVDYGEVGFTITVRQGLFNEVVTIDKDSLTFLGAQHATEVDTRTNPTASSETRVQAPTGGYAAFTTTGSGAKNITIKGFSILGTNGGAGINVLGNVDDMYIEGNLFSDFTSSLSFAPGGGSENVTFIKNRVMNSLSGPYYPNGSKGVIAFNIIDGLDEAGIILEGSDNDVLIHPYIRN